MSLVNMLIKVTTNDSICFNKGLFKVMLFVNY